jgi:hypothetical protein
MVLDTVSVTQETTVESQFSATVSEGDLRTGRTTGGAGGYPALIAATVQRMVLAWLGSGAVQAALTMSSGFVIRPPRHQDNFQRDFRLVYCGATTPTARSDRHQSYTPPGRPLSEWTSRTRPASLVADGGWIVVVKVASRFGEGRTRMVGMDGWPDGSLPATRTSRCVSSQFECP